MIVGLNKSVAMVTKKNGCPSVKYANWVCIQVLEKFENGVNAIETRKSSLR